MTEPRRDTIIVQREIAATRSHLVTNVERLRGALRRRLSLRTRCKHIRAWLLRSCWS